MGILELLRENEALRKENTKLRRTIELLNSVLHNHESNSMRGKRRYE